MKLKRATSTREAGFELKIRLAVTALHYHLTENEKVNELIAISALAMYLQSSTRKSSAKLLAQVALAIHLHDAPDTLTKAPKSYRTLAPLNSTWNNKILMMRQLPAKI